MFDDSTIRQFDDFPFAGDHRGVVIPVPIPNTEVKGSIAEGSAGLARARVGRRQLFFYIQKLATSVSQRRFAPRLILRGDAA